MLILLVNIPRESSRFLTTLLDLCRRLQSWRCPWLAMSAPQSPPEPMRHVDWHAIQCDVMKHGESRLGTIARDHSIQKRTLEAAVKRFHSTKAAEARLAFASGKTPKRP
jgi:hypothetical protein